MMMMMLVMMMIMMMTTMMMIDEDNNGDGDETVGNGESKRVTSLAAMTSSEDAQQDSTKGIVASAEATAGDNNAVTKETSLLRFNEVRKMGGMLRRQKVLNLASRGQS